MQEDGFVEVSIWLQPVVYALWSRGKVVYIGQSTQPIVRMFQHKLKNGERIARQNSRARTIERFPFDRIWFRVCTLDEIDNVERDMIFKYQPKHNIRFKDSPRVCPIDLKALVASMVPPQLQTTHPMMQGTIRRL